MAQLATRQGVGVKALMFVVLTACRTNEAVGATWNEVDLDKALWVVPAERMKGRREHRVPLAPEVLALLEELPREDGNPFLFIGARQGAPIGPDIMAHTLRQLGRGGTVHGMRAAFSTWAHETTAHSNHTIELCLAHTIGSAAEKTYRRGDMFEKRRKLMQQWARFCTTPPARRAGTVVPMRKGATA
jgi:integrase